MWNLSKILSPELALCNDTESISKKQILEKISHLAHEADHAIKYQDVLMALQKRERLGSTAVGHGVAIPHARISSLNHPICILVTLDKAVEFDQADAVAVDLIFGLLVPEDADNEHLKILGKLAEQLKSKTYRERLRAATTNEDLYHAAISNE